MPRIKSQPKQSTVPSRRRRPSRGHASPAANRREETAKIRRYLDFVRAVVGPTRNGR